MWANKITVRVVGLRLRLRLGWCNSSVGTIGSNRDRESLAVAVNNQIRKVQVINEVIEEVEVSNEAVPKEMNDEVEVLTELIDVIEEVNKDTQLDTEVSLAVSRVRVRMQGLVV